MKPGKRVEEENVRPFACLSPACRQTGRVFAFSKKNIGIWKQLRLRRFLNDYYGDIISNRIKTETGKGMRPLTILPRYG